MKTYKRTLALILVMFGVAVIGAGVWAWGLYLVTLEEQRSWLLRLAQNQAGLIEAVANFDSQFSEQDHPQGSRGATLSQIETAHENSPGFGKTGEFVLARIEGENIVFLLKRRFAGQGISETVPLNSTLAEPMHHALMGHSGTMIGTDYRNVPVLAAYEPIKGMGLGIVAKIDMTEIREPFFKVGILAGISTLFILSVGAILSHRISAPLIDSLRESEERKGTILHSAFDAIITIEEDGTVLEFNPAAETVFGFTTDQAKGQNITDLIIPPHLRDKHINGLKKYLESGKSEIIGKQIEITAIRSDGSEFPIELTISRIQLKERGLFTAFIRDLSDAKLNQLALQIAKDGAEKANLAKSEFLASMSHDLRTPLNAIMGFSEMMKEKTFGPLGDAHYDQYVRDIHEGGKLLVSLIDDILDLSKVEAGKYELFEETLNITSLIQSSVRMIATLAETASTNLVTNIEPGLPLLRGDEKSLIQVLNNLLSNAVKFTPENGTIEISAKINMNGAIDIQISDTGIGMSETDITKALKPFEQANHFHAKRHEGTGLGLHLCQKLMYLHGGIINVESTVEEGTTVTLTFPPSRTIYA
ncbi:MAG: PAS domain-containing sensor histidine kinase [Rhodospirillales bacterium]|nr:PAS domain-containing sensor histidine kinase [Rhodospirillales bacterium]